MKFNGTYIKCDLINVTVVSNIRYGYLPEFDHDCIYINKKSLIPVIIDRIKPLFGLNRLGCFYNDKHIIYKPCIINGLWAEELRLSDYTGELTPYQIDQVRRILTFRYIVGLPSINERSILVRGDKMYDYGDETVKFSDIDRCLSKSVHSRWFNKVSMVDTLISMLKTGDKFDQINDVLEIRIKIEKVIKKINKRHLDIVSLIIDRISITLDSNL